MHRFIRIVGVLAVVGAAVAWWRRNRRFGAEFVNRVVNPALMRRRWTGSGRSEIGMLEHIGRLTGTRRLTPVHPERTVDGFRIIVPLGEESQWARNVLAARHCRLQLHDMLYELDEPRLITPDQAEGLPRLVQRFESYLGFRYLALRTFAAAPGALEAAVVPPKPEEAPQAMAEAEVEVPKLEPARRRSRRGARPATTAI